MSDTTIRCKRCNTLTNHCPSEFPPEWDGYCPSCAIKLAIEGVLPDAAPGAIIEQIIRKLSNEFDIDIIVRVADGLSGDWHQVGEDENGAAYVVRQCLN